MPSFRQGIENVLKDLALTKGFRFNEDTQTFEAIARTAPRAPQPGTTLIGSPGTVVGTPAGPPSPAPTRRESFDPNEATPLPGVIDNTTREGAIRFGAGAPSGTPSNETLDQFASRAVTTPTPVTRPPRRTFTPAEQAVLTRFGGSRRRS